MPLYEYDCPACRQAFEALVFGAERPSCPRCGSAEVSKRLSTFAVTSGAPDPAPMGGCGSCGDPRGPGACQR